MPKQSPIPEPLDKPFYDACNQGKLVVQYCKTCDRLQFPPEPRCPMCGNDVVEWKQLSGRGHIYSYAVMHDTPVTLLFKEQPFNIAVIEMEQGIKMLSHLPGTPVDQVPIGADVEVFFETTPGTGQKVPEWRVVKK